MEKCYIIIVDTVINKNFNSKKVTDILKDALMMDQDSFNDKNSYMEGSVEFVEFDKNSDNISLDRILLKEHMFVNIVNANTSRTKVVNTFDFSKNHKEPINTSYHFRHYSLLQHAFTSRNKQDLQMGGKKLTVSCNIISKGLSPLSLLRHIYSQRDQLVLISPGRSFETEMKRWLLLKLASVEGNFPFYCLPILSKMISTYSGLIDMDESTIFIDECISDTQDYYTDMVTSLLSTKEITSSKDDFNLPIFLHANCNVEWSVVKGIVYSLFSGNSHYVGHYRSRLHPLCQDVNFLLVSLLRFFKVVPRNDQLPFTTAQMSTLVSDCLRTGNSLPTTKKFIFCIEDVDWIGSNTLAGHACSWLPEKCARNIVVIMTAANGSLQQKSLKSRLTPPIFVDLSFPEFLITGVHKTCLCNQRWCVSRLIRVEDILRATLSLADNKGVGQESLKIMAMFYCSLMCAMTRSQIEFLLSYHGSASQVNSDNSFEEKDGIENTEKSIMSSTKTSVSWSSSDRTDKALLHLVKSRVLCRTYLKNSTESTYSLSVPQLRGHIAPLILERMKESDLDLIKCYIGAYFVYHCTDLHQQMLFVPGHLQYLSTVKDIVLKDWLINWAVLIRFTDEYSVPVKLLSLWRSILGPDTDYSPMLNAYIVTCLRYSRSSSECPSCQQIHNVTLDCGRVCLDSLLHSTVDLSRKAARGRCKILLELARLAMQVGQYSVAKEMARVLLKIVDQSASDRSLWSIPKSDKTLLASCLHLLFCTLDERLKTFEFVTEQTTPIFRRTVHYGARALLLQDTIVEQLKRTLNRHSIDGSGDSQLLDLGKLQRKLCFAEIRLARIMTHFVFSLDGVEQTAINRHFLPCKIRAVTSVCMNRAYETATRLRDRSLLLEIQMTFGVIQPRENYKEKILLYKTPLRQALCTYGQCHIFVSRIYINIGISFEEQKKYIKAFEYFTLWSHITHELLGRNHCKSIRSCGVFKEPIFKLTAEFISHLNGERPNDSLEEELKGTVGRASEELPDPNGMELTVEGVGIANGGDLPESENVSFENMFAFRSSLEQETDWEIHSSDDETPNYTTAFEEVIDKFQKKSSSMTSIDLLHSLLDSSLVDSEDLTKEDIDFLFASHELNVDRMGALSHETQSYESTVGEAIRISRLFRGLQDLSQIFPNPTGSSLDLNLARRLLELQRDLQEFLNN